MGVYEELHACPLFSSCSLEQLKRILRPSMVTEQSYEKGQIVREQGTLYEELIVLLEGKVSARFYEYSGKTMLVETLSAPAPVASAVLFSDVNYLPVTTTADCTVRIAVIKKAAVLELFAENGEMLRKYLKEMGSKLSFLAEKVRLAGLGTLRQKITDHLLRLRDQYQSNDLKIPYSREKMAELVSAARPSLSRELSRMTEEGLITLDGRHVLILQPEKLQDILML